MRRTIFGPIRSRVIRFQPGEFVSRSIQGTPVAVRLVAGLALMVTVGTVLLLLPGMTTEPINLLEALFTATSAVTVTGLAVRTTSQDFTFLGQIVLLLLIQAGGVGFMTLVIFGLRLVGRRESLSDRLALSSSLGLQSPGSVPEIFRRTLLLVLVIEGLGAVLLYAHWKFNGVVVGDRVWFYALFHAVSAFCNAGFDLFAGLPQYPRGIPGDTLSLVIMGVLVFLGGLGLPVYYDLLRRRRGRRLSLNTRLVLITSVVLVLIGWGMLLLVEYLLAGVLVEERFLAGLTQTLFQSVAARTAGFPGFEAFTYINQSSRLILMILMFIGTAPASMGGGITIGSFSVLVLAMWNFARGLPDVRIWNRTISDGTVRRATVIGVISLLVVVTGTMLLLLTHPMTLDNALFEVVSALSTCGLSLGVTTRLNTFGRLLIMGIMFWGRLGAVTVMVALLGRRGSTSAVSYPEDTVLVG